MFKTTEDLPQSVRSKVRFISNNDCVILERFIKSTISEHKSQGISDCSVLFHISVDNNLATKVMEGVEFMESVGIWNEACSSQNFSLVSEHTTMCTTEMDSDDD